MIQSFDYSPSVFIISVFISSVMKELDQSVKTLGNERKLCKLSSKHFLSQSSVKPCLILHLVAFGIHLFTTTTIAKRAIIISIKIAYSNTQNEYNKMIFKSFLPLL